jgi:N-acetyl-anhydromuramoyl-L-alanine amidase
MASIESELIDGWWSKATQRRSPNCDERPADSTVDMLVIHAISLPPSEFGSGDIHKLFCNTLDCSQHPYYQGLIGLAVSAHFLIDRDGCVAQYVSVFQQAWHAGASRFGGRERCNARSIGIELEGDDASPFTVEQSSRLIQLARVLVVAFPAISLARMVGHVDIAPTRKTDPGPCFDWIAFRAALVPARLSERAA